MRAWRGQRPILYCPALDRASAAACPTHRGLKLCELPGPGPLLRLGNSGSRGGGLQAGGQARRRARAEPPPVPPPPPVRSEVEAVPATAAGCCRHRECRVLGSLSRLPSPRRSLWDHVREGGLEQGTGGAGLVLNRHLAPQQETSTARYFTKGHGHS